MSAEPRKANIRAAQDPTGEPTLESRLLLVAMKLADWYSA